MHCTRCEGTGFLNLEQVPTETLAEFEKTGDHNVILTWIHDMDRNRQRYGCSCHIAPPCSSCVDYWHDVSVCDCCGNGDHWHGTPGEHHNWPKDEPIPDCI